MEHCQLPSFEELPDRILNFPMFRLELTTSDTFKSRQGKLNSKNNPIDMSHSIYKF